MSIKSLLLTVATALLLSACGSAVKLDNVPVEDRSGAAVDNNAAQTAVAPVDADKVKVQPGPAGVARVVYFDFDSFVIKPEAKPVIEAHANYLKADKARKVNLEGHTDERGGREYNLALGQKRAEAVRRALSLLGVADGQMEAVSFGKEKPANEGHDEAAWAKNRRVELTYR